jgi:hypothetical protein
MDCRDDQLELEEFYMVISETEACLHSCLIMVLSSDPNDLQSLSPGHFLNYRPLDSIPEPNLPELEPNLLTWWQLVQRLFKQF